MLTPEDVRRVALEEGLADFADSLVDHVRPGWRLDVRRDDARPRAGAAKIGGEPDLAVGEMWPINRRGVAMTFLAQVNCDELPALDPDWRALTRRPSGEILLRVFADLVDNPHEPGPASVLTTSTAETLVRTPAPAIPEPWPAGGQCDGLGPSERVRVLPEIAVQPVAFLTAPETHPILSPDGGLTGRADRYYAWANRLRLDGVDYNAESATEPFPWEIHHFLGEASSVQCDVRETGVWFFEDAATAEWLGAEGSELLADVEAWQTLLALHDDARSGLHILDGGAYTVLIPSIDLRVGRYDRTVCSVASC
jgi:hypothetical protein